MILLLFCVPFVAFGFTFEIDTSWMAFDDSPAVRWVFLYDWWQSGKPHLQVVAYHIQQADHVAAMCIACLTFTGATTDDNRGASSDINL